jgi:iron complex transport system substrate-binding protein
MRLLAPALALLCWSCAQNASPDPRAIPKRVLALAPNLAETWAYACGSASLVGRVSFSDFPPELEALPSVGSALGPDLERLSSLRPDLLLLTGGAAGGPVATALAGAGHRLEIFPMESPAQVLTAVQRMEQLCGATGAASRRLELALAAAGGPGPGPGAPRVLMLHGHQPLVAAGPGSWGDALLHLAGVHNAIPRNALPYPSLSAEDVAALAPDCILDSTGVYEKPMNELALQLPKSAALVPLEDPAILRPGPRFPQALEALNDALRRCLPGGPPR